jgi:dTMP kinase
LATGTTVICDRYADSTTAYQGYGRGIDLDTIQNINMVATQGLVPDVVILVDVPAEVGLARRKSTKLDRFEKEEISFHHRVRQGYLQLAAAAPQRWLVVDALLPEAEIEQAVWEKVAQLLER